MDEIQIQKVYLLLNYKSRFSSLKPTLLVYQISCYVRPT